TGRHTNTQRRDGGWSLLSHWNIPPIRSEVNLQGIPGWTASAYCDSTAYYYSMSERKVINKYIPPNFDPERVPRGHRRSKHHTVRLMAPFSMRCTTCGEYIYKGRKFNARKENCPEEYLGIRIFRFYIRCPQCAAEITYKTDPKNADYECEHGAKRNFEPWREERAEEEASKRRREVEELHNPMRALENKSYDAKRELDIVEALDEIRTMNTRLERVDTDVVFARISSQHLENAANVDEVKAKEQAEDEAIIREAFANVQRQQQQQEQEDTVTINTNELLLGASASKPKRKLDPSSLGIFDFQGSIPVKFRDEPVREELAAARLEFRLLRNTGSAVDYEILTALKHIFQRQLPKMPREYITRLVYDRRHDSLAVLRPHGVIGGITYRVFPDRGFCEIVFCAISSSEQVKGFGAAVMNQLKEQVGRVSNGRVKHYLTYADNYAIGYFKKQGFSREVTLDRTVWAGYIKDYDGGTLMQCTVVEGVDYLNVFPMLHRQKMNLVKEIANVTDCAKVYAGINAPLTPEQIPGLLQAGWTPEMSQKAESARRGRLYEMLRPLLNELQSHPAAWPFLKPVDGEEVSSYYTVIREPMDLASMDSKLEGDQYKTLPEFIADFNLVVQNCRLFNDPDTSYCKNATNLEKFFQERLRARDSHR
ncbi:hypothetical protein PSACC_02405, partial [Paramicrosporidium saccamoebae]